MGGAERRVGPEPAVQQRRRVGSIRGSRPRAQGACLPALAVWAAASQSCTEPDRRLGCQPSRRARSIAEARRRRCSRGQAGDRRETTSRANSPGPQPRVAVARAAEPADAAKGHRPWMPAGAHVATALPRMREPGRSPSCSRGRLVLVHCRRLGRRSGDARCPPVAVAAAARPALLPVLRESIAVPVSGIPNGGRNEVVMVQSRW
jgi:hypothetical protein